MPLRRTPVLLSSAFQPANFRLSRRELLAKTKSRGFVDCLSLITLNRPA